MTTENPTFDTDGPILVVLPAQTLDGAQEDLLRVGRELAAVAGTELVALRAGGAATAGLAGSGVTRLLRPLARGEGAQALAVALDADLPSGLADAALAAIAAVRPRVVLAASSPTAAALAASIAVRTSSGAVVDASQIAPSEAGGVRVTRPVLDSSWMSTCELPAGVVTVRSGAAVLTVAGEPAEAVSGAAGSLATEEIHVEASAATRAVTLDSHDEAEEGGDLTSAERVVVAGRGVQGDLTLIHELADALGASVGATRVVTDHGWAARELQVGQSGVVISPRLYLGAGASGQLHHTMGIMGSEHIVAICDDPDAPIFEMADFGVVGDLTEVIAQALEELRAGGAGD